MPALPLFPAVHQLPPPPESAQTPVRRAETAALRADGPARMPGRIHNRQSSPYVRGQISESISSYLQTSARKYLPPDNVHMSGPSLQTCSAKSSSPSDRHSAAVPDPFLPCHTASDRSTPQSAPRAPSDSVSPLPHLRLPLLQKASQAGCIIVVLSWHPLPDAVFTPVLPKSLRPDARCAPLPFSQRSGNPRTHCRPPYPRSPGSR